MGLEKILSQDAHLKIIKFFNENPRSIDTITGISGWVGLTKEVTKKALKNLVKHAILIEHKTNTTKAYSYTQDKKILLKIKKWLKTSASVQ